MHTIYRFFKPRPLDTPEFSIRGIGVSEVMQPTLIERPNGKPDFLMMLFATPAVIKVKGELHEYPLDTMMIWEPGHEQLYGNVTLHWNHSWIHCEGTRVSELIYESGLPLNEPFALVDRSVVDHYLLEIYRELTLHGAPSPIIVANAFSSWLVDMQRQAGGGTFTVPPDYLAIQHYMGEHMNEPLTLSSLSSRMALSPSQFSSCFKLYFGQPPIDYLIDLRLHTASNLLGDANRSIAEIAAAVGYDDQFHFSKQFKARLGASPREMRKAFR